MRSIQLLKLWMLITFEWMDGFLNFKKVKWSEFQALSRLAENAAIESNSLQIARFAEVWHVCWCHRRLSHRWSRSDSSPNSSWCFSDRKSGDVALFIKLISPTKSSSDSYLRLHFLPPCPLFSPKLSPEFFSLFSARCRPRSSRQELGEKGG